MPNLTVGKLRAIVEVDTSQLRKAKTDVKGFGMDIKSTFKSINRSIRNTGLIATTAISVPLAMFGVASVKAASDAVEMTNVFNVAFQGIRQESEKTANRLASDFDLASSTSKKLLGDVGDLMIGFGLTDKAALSLANRTLRIAGDLTSFRNIAGGIPAVTNAIFRGMLGISQALKPLGVAMNQRSKQFRAQIKEMMVTRGLTEQIARAELVLQEVIKQSVNAVGDYNRTRGELANTSRRLGEMMKFMREEFGKILIQGLRLDIIIRALGTGMRILAKTLSIIPSFLRPIIGGFVLLAISIPPVVVGFAIFNLAILSLQKNTLTLTGALKLQTFFMNRYVIPSVIKAIVSFSTWSASINASSISLVRLKATSISAITSVKALTVSIKALWAWMSPILAPIAILLGAIALAVGSIAWAYKRIKASLLKSDLAAVNGILKSTVSIFSDIWRWTKIIADGFAKTIVLVFTIFESQLADFILLIGLTAGYVWRISKNVVSGLSIIVGAFFKDLGKMIASTGKSFLNMFKGDFSAPTIDLTGTKKALSELNIFESFPDIMSQTTNMNRLWNDYVNSLLPNFTGTKTITGNIGASPTSETLAIPELSSAAIRGTSEAVKIENQRSTNRKVEDNTKRTAQNTAKMAEMFSNNQVVLMPANLTA